MNTPELVFSVSDFVAFCNQTLEYAYPSVTIVGELSGFRISKNRWVYFDLKDQQASVRFFGTVYQMPGPLEDGMMVEVRGQPRLHPQFGFSITVSSLRPVGEGSIKQAMALLEAKLRAEGLFELGRKRTLPYPPKRIGLITSMQSAAYADFIKILQQRWVGVEIEVIDTQVQGAAAVGQIVEAVQWFNEQPVLADVLVITRGGGSPDDLAAFNTEQITRAVASSRVPTLVAIGHEIDTSLAELAADQRASTPSNAAELLVPDKRQVAVVIARSAVLMGQALSGTLAQLQEQLNRDHQTLQKTVQEIVLATKLSLKSHQELLGALSPQAVLRRGYAIVRYGQHVLTSTGQVKTGVMLDVELHDGVVQTQVTGTTSK